MGSWALDVIICMACAQCQVRAGVSAGFGNSLRGLRPVRVTTRMFSEGPGLEDNPRSAPGPGMGRNQGEAPVPRASKSRLRIRNQGVGSPSAQPACQSLPDRSSFQCRAHADILADIQWQDPPVHTNPDIHDRSSHMRESSFGDWAMAGYVQPCEPMPATITP